MKQVFMILVLLSSQVLFGKTETVTLIGDPVLKFTGYKFLDKTPVSGTFKTITWTPAKRSVESEDKIGEMLKGSKIKIDSYSIDAGNAARNTNITQSLFKSWGGRYIEGEITEVFADGRYLKVELDIGDNEAEAVFQYHIAKDKIVFTSTLDLIQMGFQAAFGKLAKKCAALHKGKDGVTKTWSVVDLAVEAPISIK